MCVNTSGKNENEMIAGRMKIENALIQLAQMKKKLRISEQVFAYEYL